MVTQRRTGNVLDLGGHAYTWANGMESAQGHGQERHRELRGRVAAPHPVLGEVQGRLPGGGASVFRLAGWGCVWVKSVRNFQVEGGTQGGLWNTDSLPRELEMASEGDVWHCTRLERPVRPWCH